MSGRSGSPRDAARSGRASGSGIPPVRRSGCRLLLPLLLLSAAFAGEVRSQDPLSRIRSALAAGDRAAAEAALGSVLRSGEGGEGRYRTLTQGLDLLRDAGFTEGALRALDAALAARPRDPLLLYHRGLVRRDLKLLAGARDDLRAALALDPGADSLEGELALIAAFDFDHEAAARLFEDARMTEAARFERRLAVSHEDAATRQWIALVLGLVFLVVPRILFRSRPAAGA